MDTFLARLLYLFYHSLQKPPTLSFHIGLIDYLDIPILPHFASCHLLTLRFHQILDGPVPPFLCDLFEPA